MFITHIKRYPGFYKINTLVMAAMCAAIVFLGYKLAETRSLQCDIILVLEKTVKNQGTQEIRTHAIEIKAKIDNYTPTGNIIIDENVIKLYTAAYDLAMDKNPSYIFLESSAESIIEAYKQGTMDGNKKWMKRQNQL